MKLQSIRNQLHATRDLRRSGAKYGGEGIYDLEQIIIEAQEEIDASNDHA
tara:strand:- start:268 stop:417 length:150 start_codon:yes stop_codon:yes gene_type:complete